MDLLTLSKKDAGYIRANVGVPYPISQLAGMFNATSRLVSDTIHKAIQYKKLQLMEDGTLFVCSTGEYELSERHRRRLAAAIMSSQPDTMSANEDDSVHRVEVEVEKSKVTTTTKEVKGEKLPFAAAVQQSDACKARFAELFPVASQRERNTIGKLIQHCTHISQTQSEHNDALQVLISIIRRASEGKKSIAWIVGAANKEGIGFNKRTQQC